MKILFDTNVILDVLIPRIPHAESAVKLFQLMAKGEIQGVLCADSLTTIYYICAKAAGRPKAIDNIRDLLARFEIAPIDQNILSQALDIGFNDYEDAVIHEAARKAKAKLIVSRDKKGFAGATIPVYSPAELLATKSFES